MKEVLRTRLSLIVLVLALVSLSYAFRNSDYSNNAITGDQLSDLILENREKIIVTLWTMNIHNEDQIKKNNIAKSSMRRLVSKCYTNVIYNEAEVSDIDHQQSSYRELAQDWNLDLNKLRIGPMIMVVFQTKGEIFWSTENTMLIKLLDRIDVNVREIERRSIGNESPKCSVKLDYSELNADFKNNLSSVSIGRSGPGSTSRSKSIGGLNSSNGSGSGSSSRTQSIGGSGPGSDLYPDNETFRSSSYDNSVDSYKSLSSTNAEPDHHSDSHDNSETRGRTSSSSSRPEGGKSKIILNGSTSSSSQSIEVRVPQPKPTPKPTPKPASTPAPTPPPAPKPKPKPKITLREPNKAMLRKKDI